MERAKFICRIRKTADKSKPKGAQRTRKRQARGQNTVRDYYSRKSDDKTPKGPQAKIFSLLNKAICAVPKSIPQSQEMFDQILDMEQAKQLAEDNNGFIFDFDKVITESPMFDSQRKSELIDEVKPMLVSMFKQLNRSDVNRNLTILSFGTSKSEKEMIYKREGGLVQTVMNEMMSLCDASQAMKRIKSFNLTFHVLLVNKNKVMDLLRHPKDILKGSKEEKSPFVTIEEDAFGRVNFGSAVEFELESLD